MRIGIDARPLAALPFAGISYYLLNLLKQFEKIESDVEFYLYSNFDFALPFNNSRWKKRLGSGPLRTIGAVWMCSQGRRMVLEDKIDVFWTPWPILPYGLPIKKAVTVHDFVWSHYPQTMHPSQWVLYNVIAAKSIREADAIFSISASTLQDVVKVRGNNQGVNLIYNGVDSAFKPLNHLESESYICKKYKCSSPYLLNVGTLEPRKNIINLLRAFKELKKKYQIPHQLVIAGAKGWKESPIWREHQDLQLKDSVLFLGYVDDQDMPPLYSGAEVFIYPSFYEGFGFPPLEAMACGCPVVVSNASSLPEVVGDCGLLINPHDPVDIASKVHDLISQHDLRKILISKGIERSKMFSWESSAQKMLKILVDL